MKRKPKFEVYPAADGYRWRLKAANGRIVATGEAHPARRMPYALPQPCPGWLSWPASTHPR